MRRSIKVPCRCCKRGPSSGAKVRDRAPKFRSSPTLVNYLCDDCWNDPSLAPGSCRHGGYVPTYERLDGQKDR